jgi:hypothetical protein
VSAEVRDSAVFAGEPWSAAPDDAGED